jgi:predicted DNA-binding protein
VRGGASSARQFGPARDGLPKGDSSAHFGSYRSVYGSLPDQPPIPLRSDRSSRREAQHDGNNHAYMIRTEIQLTAEQVRQLKRIAAERGISVSAVIREAVEKAVGVDDGPAKRQRALAAVGRFRSGKHDVSTDHDRYLGEDFPP